MMAELADGRTDQARCGTQGLRRILVATDFSAASERARDYAIALAAPSTSLTLLHAHALPLPSGPDREPLPDWMGPGPSPREEALERLHRFGAPARAALLSARIVLQEGLPADVILAQAAALEPDLIAMGTHGRPIVERWVLGSTAERVARLSATPVLTVSTHGLGAGSRIREVLCPVGVHSHPELIAFAAELAARCRSALTVLHVIEGGHAPGRWREQRARERLREVVAEAGQAGRAEMLLRAGQPAREILSALSERAVDLIVMGAHAGRLSGGHRCFGGTADAVVREAGCAVIRLPAGIEAESRESLEAGAPAS
jgi:nucleotide-binding universal stress UspA family protein